MSNRNLFLATLGCLLVAAAAARQDREWRRDDGGHGETGDRAAQHVRIGSSVQGESVQSCANAQAY